MKYLVLIVLLLCAVTVSATLSSNTGWVVGWKDYDPGGWTSTHLTKVSDDQRAQIAGTTLDSFAVYMCGLPIPQDAGTTVDSVDVRIEAQGSGLASATRRVYYVALSTNGGVSRAGNWATDTSSSSGDAVSTIATNQNGEGDRTWSATLTPANVASDNFAVMIKKTVSHSSAILYIDKIEVRVWWTSPTAAIFGRGTNNFVETYIKQNSATTNYNTDTTFAVGSNTGLGDARVWVFRVPGLAAYMSGKSNIDGQIVLHTLANTYLQSYDTLGFQIVRQANRYDWDTLLATYNIYKLLTNWGTAGAFNTSSDIYGNDYSKWDSTEYRDNGYMTLDVSSLLRAYTDSIFTMRQVGSSIDAGVVLNVHSANCSTDDFKPYLVVWQGASTATHNRTRRTANSRTNK